MFSLEEKGEAQLVSFTFYLGFSAVWKKILWRGYGYLVFELTVFGFGFQSGSS
jgi:hypothetical protein